MHTRFSRKTSPLVFYPEIEKTARRNRNLQRSQVFVHPIAQEINKAISDMSNHSVPVNQDPPLNQNPPQQPPLHYRGMDYPPFVPHPQHLNNPHQPQFPRRGGRAFSDGHVDPINRQGAQPQRAYNDPTDDWDDRVHNWDGGLNNQDEYDDELDNDSVGSQYGYQQNQQGDRNYNAAPPVNNQGYPGQLRGNRQPPNANNRPREVGNQYNDGVPRVNNRAPIQGVKSINCIKRCE